ncbi:diphthine synthase [Candidatus Pacearchaeota archaeon]|nr:diphthine synthase [Candidatus Pacearchaeota archaeon]
MLYFIGLGLNEQGISLQGLSAIKSSKKIYLEVYTVSFPYSIKKLEKIFKRKIIVLNREQVESDFLIKEAKKQSICLLVYGSPLFATTHISLIEECKKQIIKFKIVYSASIFDAIAETGLQLYKFGKITSMPEWEKNYQPESFIDYVIENKKINAHSLILINPLLSFKQVLEQLEESSKAQNLYFDKIIICSMLGTKNSKILYGSLDKLKTKSIKEPFCIIFPGKMHFVEEEIVKKFEVN